MLKARSLGSFTSAARGILISGGTNATPIVATVTAGHGMKNNDRICIQGVTTLTSMNGEFSLDSVGATAATLRGSAGNGAFGGTAVVATVQDVTPHLAKHSGVVLFGNMPGQAVFVGTVVVEYADSVDGTQFLYTNSSGVATAGFTSALLGGDTTPPAATAGIFWCYEVQMARYLAARCSAYTSGGANAKLLA